MPRGGPTSRNIPSSRSHIRVAISGICEWLHASSEPLQCAVARSAPCCARLVSSAILASVPPLMRDPLLTVRSMYRRFCSIRDTKLVDNMFEAGLINSRSTLQVNQELVGASWTSL